MPQRSGRARMVDPPPRQSLAGYVLLITTGLVLLAAACAGGVIMVWKAPMVPVDSVAETADTRQVCVDVKQLNIQYRDKIAASYQKLIDALIKDDEAAGQQALDEIKPLASAWIGELRKQADRTDNAELQKTIDDMATELKRFESGEASLNDAKALVETTNTELIKFCA